MAMETENYGLYLEDSDKTTFKDWRNKINGPNGSNMEKIDKVLCDKQDKITGTIGQVVGFDKDGNAVAQPAPDTGVTTFNGRKGGVVPQDGDYTAEMVGARPAGWTPTAADVGAPTLDEMNAAIQTAASGIDVGVTTFNGRKGAVTPASGDYTAAQVGAVPTTRKVNNKPLSSDITLSASDVGALSTSGGTIDGDLTITEGHAIKFDLITGSETGLFQTGADTVILKADKLRLQTFEKTIDVDTLGSGVASFNGRTGAVTPASGDYTAAQVGAVPTIRKVNGKVLSSDITLNASDVSAVPTTRKVNGKALSSDITLSASDVSAVPTARTVNGKALSSNISLTASDVSALPITGGTLTGNLTIKGSGNYGTKINLGDGDYVHISEPTDDNMEIKAKTVKFVTTKNSSGIDIDDLKTSVSDGKAAIASAITDKGVSTSSTATFSTMASNIRNINSGGSTGKIVCHTKSITTSAYIGIGANIDGIDSNSTIVCATLQVAKQMSLNNMGDYFFDGVPEDKIILFDIRAVFNVDIYNSSQYGDMIFASGIQKFGSTYYLKDFLGGLNGGISTNVEKIVFSHNGSFVGFEVHDQDYRFIPQNLQYWIHVYTLE